ncbi:MAG: hypothetical protein V9E94_09835 [Microthrixaceae bacterium]
MPVERRTGSKQVTAVVFGVVAVLLAIGLAWGMLALASGGDGPVRVQLGDDEFRVGNAERQARQIAEDGPAIYSDVSGRGQRQPIVVNHFGDDAEIRWVAFPAVLPGASEGCFLAWNAELDLFEERRPPEGGGRDDVGELCSDRTAAPNGEGLEQYGWQVDDDGNLLIDVRGDAASTTTGG